MFAHDKRIGPYTYVYLVEYVRKSRPKHRIIANIQRKEVVVTHSRSRPAGALPSSGSRCVSMVLSLVEGEAPPEMQGVSGLDRRCCSSGCGMGSAAAPCDKKLAAGRQFEFYPSAQYS